MEPKKFGGQDSHGGMGKKPQGTPTGKEWTPGTPGQPKPGMPGAGGQGQGKPFDKNKDRQKDDQR